MNNESLPYLKHYSFHKKQRLKTNSQFKTVLSRQCCFSHGLFRLYAAHNIRGFARLGVSIGRSCGPAVVRNRLKRLTREVFRLHQHNLPSNLDYLLIYTRKSPKRCTSTKSMSCHGLTYREMEDIFLTLAHRAAKRLNRPAEKVDPEKST